MVFATPGRNPITMRKAKIFFSASQLNFVVNMQHLMGLITFVEVVSHLEV